MDAIVNKAIEELCIQCCKGSNNSVPIHNLWLNLKPYLSKNGISLCGTVKKAVLSNLINIPGLEFESIDCSITSRGGSTGSGLEFESKDGNINDLVKCNVEECERLDDLNIVVPKSMLDNFSRIHEVEVSKSKLSKQELEALHLRKRVLQRIAIARANGITQSELTKEFNTKANNFFHILKELQTLGLILSHQVTVWENETSNDGKLINKHISTNMLYLSLYGKHLRCQQRLEIRKRGLMADDRENVLIKDDLPSLRDICNILEKAKGKVLRISNIKKDLGYHDAAGHKRWANILRKLTQAQVVEVIEKDKFLRLLKAFSPMHFDTRKRRSDDLGREQPPTIIEKRDQIGQQIVELPIEPQTCGIIHAEGSREIRDVEEVQYQGNNRMSTAHSSTDVSNTVNDTKMQIMMRSSVCDLVPVKTSATETISPRCQAYKAYPSHKLRADCAREQREHWILKMLEEEKFLIKPDLQRRLERLEKGRHTSMDKKTLERSLNKLQQKGHCKCLDVFFPAVTNFCENAKRVVVLHPSIYGLSPALLVKIYDRIRSFERELRGTSFSKFQKGDALPIVYDVGRGQQRIEMDVQDALVKKSRGKKSLMEKMARAKLLHIYLWEYVNSLPDSEDTSSSGKYGYDLKNDDSSCKLVDIGSAIEAMQLELFLQVSGSAQMHENVFEKCGDYLHRSGIPMKDYTCLKDTPSIKELSLLIAVLQRFKLIRLVCGEHTVDATQVTQITLTHALELKPFSSAARSSSFHGPDSCHQVRHDFVLSNRKAVDEYWNTLEYFLAGPNPEAASNASPGNDVPAVKEVLQRFHNRKQKRLSRSQGVLNSKWMVHLIKGRNNSSRKRKRSSGGVPSRHVKLHTSDVQPSDKSTCDTVEQFPDEQNALVVSPGDIGCNSQINCVGDHGEVTEGIEQWEKNEGNHSFMKRSDLSSLKPTCRAIFSWTEDADRQLVIEYVRLRAALGPYSRCFKWASVKHLPASPDACKRRMAILMKGCIQFRSALMKLCNVVSERYARYLQNRSLDCGDCEETVQHDASEDLNQGVSDSPEHSREAAEERWDDFDVYNVKVALDKVLECKKMAKLNGSNGVQSANANSDLSINAERPEKSSHWVPKRCGHPLIESNNIRRQPFESVAVANAVELSKLAVLTTSRSQLVPTSLVETFKHYSEHDKVLAFNFLKEMKLLTFLDSSLRVRPSWIVDKVLECKKMAKLNGSNGVQSANANSDLSINAERPEKSSHWVPKRCGHPLIESNNIRRQPFESVAVANAVELSKLAVLTTSRSQLVPTSLVETFKHYSEHDKVLAFNFLKEMKLIESRAKNPVALSGKFFDSMFSSPFPIKTGEQAAKFSTWLHEREKEMVNGGVVLPRDLQCGDVLNLCGLLSSGELSIIPCLPAKGVGKAKDARTLKRKNNITNFRDGSRGKTYRIGESEARRAKGFPDISLSLSRATFFSTEVVEFFKNDENQPLTQIGEENQVKIMSVLESSSSASYLEGKNNVEEAHENGSYGYTAVSSKELLWKAMASSAEHFCSFSSKKESSAFNPELFRSLLLAIQKAGDQGLTMKEISMSVNVQGEKMLDVIVDVLETFGQVLKVNGYDSVNVVDSSYHSKYFLSTVPVNRQDSLVTLAGADDAQKELGMNAEFHNPTNREQPSEPLLERQSTNRNDSLEFQTAKSHPCKPILPWIDGDGTFNNGVYRKLVSRALGIIMQKPGILEDHVIDQMHGMNPQSCRTLLEMMILDNHIVVRKMFETIAGPPAILSGLLGTQFVKSKLILKRHLFANPRSTSHL